MDDLEINRQLLMALGELKGAVDGLKHTMDENQHSTNRRIDDLKSHVTDRLDLQDTHIMELRKTQNQMLMRSSVSGGVSGGLVVALSELAKLLN